MRSRISGGLPLHLQRGIDARHQPLARRFFVTRRAVNLPAQEQSGNLASLERALQFRGIDGIVLDGISRAKHVSVFKARNRLQNRQLHVHRQRGAHAVDVDLVRVQALGLEEELVHLLVGKLYDLVFDRRDNSAGQSTESARCTWENGERFRG